MIAAVILAAAVSGGANAAQAYPALPLAAAVRNAVRISPDVAQARARVAENQALLAAARGIAAPALTLDYAAAPQGGSANNTIEQSLTTLGAGVTLGDYLSFAPQVRAAQFTLAAAHYDLLDAERTERVKTIGLYYAALQADAAERVRSEDYAGAQSDLRAAHLRFKAGDVPRLDVVRAQVALAAAQASLDAARVEAANAENALAVETGARARSFGKPVPSAIPAPPEMDPQKAVARALAQRSDLASAQQAVRAEQAAVGAAKRGTLPAVTLNAGYTRGYDSGVLVSGPAATVNVSLPLSHAAADRVAAERARLQQARQKVAALTRSITVGVSSAARTYAESARAVASAHRALLAAKEELHAVEIGYRSGASSSLDVADARRTYVQAELAESNALYARAQAAATLEEEMGP